MSTPLLTERRLTSVLGASFVGADALAKDLSTDLAALVATDATLASNIALAANANTRPLYNIADSGVTYSPKASPVDMSAALLQADIDAGGRQLFIPLASGAEQPSIYISEPYKLQYGLQGVVANRNSGSPQSRIRAVPTGFSGNGVISMEDAADFCSVRQMSIYGLVDDATPVAAITNSTDVGNSGNVFALFQQNVLYGDNDTYVIYHPDPGPDNQNLNSIWIGNWVIGIGGCKMFYSQNVQDGAGSTWIDTWWNFGTAEVNSSPWNITCATVFMYNSFCDLGGISASADGPKIGRASCRERV